MSAGCTAGPVVCWHRQFTDGHTMHHGIISSCQSAVASETVTSDSCEQWYRKYQTAIFYLPHEGLWALE